MRYSSSFVRSRSDAPGGRIALIGIAQLLDDSGHVLGAHRLAVAVVDDDDRPPPAAAGALDRPQRHGAVLRRLAGPYAELLLERLQHLLRADERARDVGAELDEVPAHRLQVEHVVEGRDRLAVRGREVERLAHFLEGLRREPTAVPLLRDPERGQDRRARHRVLLRHAADLVDHRSTSPMTVSSEPTMAIRSATSAFDMHVAVASSATKDVPRNFTRHGRGPPSETT